MGRVTLEGELELALLGRDEAAGPGEVNGDNRGVLTCRRGGARDMSQMSPLLQIVISEREVKPLTLVLVLVLSSELLGDVLLLQVQDSLLLLFQPAEASSPERRVLVHQFLDSDLRLLRAVVGPAPVSRR